ncbi:MAG: DUF4832 domain-containing protein [Planctomycetaceae bacterium]
MRTLTGLWLMLLGVCSQLSAAEMLPYVPAPPDNPLKGLVPYARPTPGRFPHSMEFSYLPLSDLLVGPEQYDWQPLEHLLDDIASRRHQAVFRIWMEYPGRKAGIPEYLEREGLRVTEWLNTNTDPFPRQQVRTPDYANPRLRSALKHFIAALGDRYDGDPRIGYITAGLLGTWGEWHTYPRSELMASKEVQAEVMDAYEQAFQRTPILVRYPAGDNAWAHAPNHNRRLGYHDDSFAWATLDTGRKQDDWFFVPALKSAGDAALNKWKTSPIGGEIRPELWGQIFDDRPQHKKAQDFAECVRQTHATWLMDTGMFREQAQPTRQRNAIEQVRKLGYEFHIQQVEQSPSAGGGLTLTIRIRNTGSAPFYHDWPIELATVNADGIGTKIPVDWTVQGLLPDDPPREWKVKIPSEHLTAPNTGLALRIANPLPNGLPVRFANEYPDESSTEWWRLP